MRKRQLQLSWNTPIIPRIQYKRKQVFVGIGIITILMVLLSSISLQLRIIDDGSISSIPNSLLELESDGKDLHNLGFFSTPSSSITLNDSSESFLGFTENRGQVTDPDLYYYILQDTVAIGFYQSQLRVFSRFSSADPWESLNITFFGAFSCIPRGIERLRAITNYFNCESIITDVPQWAEIQYNSLYPGVTMCFYFTLNVLKYDFIISPYVDPSVIQLEINTQLPIDVEITPTRVVCTSQTASGLILWEDRSPIAYQSSNTAISVNFQPIGSNLMQYGVNIANYDSSQPLVIDPIVFVFGTSLGGSRADSAHGIVVDANGYIYVTGITDCSDFPVINAFDPIFNEGIYDLFIAKFAPDGQSMIFSTYLGGSGYESSSRIAVDSTGSVYICGTTNSIDFPLVFAYDTTPNGNYDGFLTRLAADGQSLLFSTYLGGSAQDYVNSLTINNLHNVYLVGRTNSSDFPMINAYDSTYNGGGDDGFLTIFTADGQSVLYSTYLGGLGIDTIIEIAIDDANRTSVVGYTNSTDFPTQNPYDATLNGDRDVFVAKFSPDGQSLLYSTYLGGSDFEYGTSIVVDSDGYLYITGSTYSSNFPLFNAYDSDFQVSEIFF